MRLSRNIFASPPLAVLRAVTNQKGMALVLALVTMLLVSMIGLFGAVSSQTELTITKNEEDSKKALNVAEAGVRHALRLLANGSAYQNGFNDELSNGGTGGGLAAAGSTVTSYPGDTGAAALLQYRFFGFGGSALGDGYYVRAIDNYDSDGSVNTDIDQRFILISRGKFGTAEKTIEALVAPPTPCALTMGNRLDLGGNFGSTDLQVNTTDGFGACAHANGPLNIGGSVALPDGASSSVGNPPGDCSGSPDIGNGGDCDDVLWNQPKRELPNTNAAQYAQWVAALGNAYSCSAAGCVAAPFYILHTEPVLGHLVGQISKGGGCYITTDTTIPIPPNSIPVGLPSSLMGRCGASIPYADSTFSPGEMAVTSTESTAILAHVTLDAGKCIFSSSSSSPLPPGIYYCDGVLENQGQVYGPGVTVISRDDMSFTSQTNLTAFFPNVGTATLNALEANFTDPTNTASATIKLQGSDAKGKLQNLVMMVGNDLDFSGNNTNITGIILVHNEVNMTGGKTITGYLIAADGLLGFTGDPHPAGSASTITPSLTYNKLSGSSEINYMNYGTANPMGAPILRAWNDGQW
jgi:hypothetical protein